MNIFEKMLYVTTYAVAVSCIGFWFGGLNAGQCLTLGALVIAVGAMIDTIK